MKHTKQILEKLASESKSVSEILSKLGLRRSGSSHAHITSRLKLFGINVSHFTGCAHNKGKPSNKRLSWQEILVKQDSDYRIHANKLRRALLEMGRPHQCEMCGMGPEWNGLPLCLPIDHKNGDWSDNTPENLRFTCPNCHSQTDTFGCKNAKYASVAECRRPVLREPFP